MLFVADTHALVWALTNQKRRLGRRARKAFEAADNLEALIRLSVVTLLELDWLEEAGKLKISDSFEGLVRNLSLSAGYEIVPLTTGIVMRSRKFRALGPMDRLIVATAEDLDSPLITADRTIQDSGSVPVVWD